MKVLLIPFIMLTIINNCFAQGPSQLKKTDSIQIEKQVELKSLNLKHVLNKKEDRYSGDLFIEFAIDTFKIEEKQRLKLDIDYSTRGMVVSARDATLEYDKLLNKYYGMLLKNLNKADREILKKTQRNWIAFRDSELELNSTLMHEYYSGGGTIQRVIAASRVLELTKNRVIELYYYLDRK